MEYGQTPGRDRPGLGRRSQQLQVQAEADAHTLAGCPNNHQPLLSPPCRVVLLQHHVVPSAHEADIGLAGSGSVAVVRQPAADSGTGTHLCTCYDGSARAAGARRVTQADSHHPALTVRTQRRGSEQAARTQ